MTKDETLRLALDTLKEVQEETFRLLRNGQTLYAEDNVWFTIIAIQEALKTKDEQRTWIGLTDEEIQECLQGLPTQTIDVYARRIEAKLKEKNT
jgi:hypothetical protein